MEVEYVQRSSACPGKFSSDPRITIYPVQPVKYKKKEKHWLNGKRSKTLRTLPIQNNSLRASTPRVETCFRKGSAEVCVLICLCCPHVNDWENFENANFSILFISTCDIIRYRSVPVLYASTEVPILWNYFFCLLFLRQEMRPTSPFMAAFCSVFFGRFSFNRSRVAQCPNRTKKNYVLKQSWLKTTTWSKDVGARARKVSSVQRHGKCLHVVNLRKVIHTWF